MKFTPFQVIVHLACYTQVGIVAYDYFFTNNLAANPIQYLTLKTGKAALILLCCSLACTPLATLGFRSAVKVRRPLGVYAFLYALIHFFIFVGLDYGFEWGLIYDAIFKKPYALVGFGAFLIMLPLALTSTQGWQRRLGLRWKRLHQLVYGAILLVIIHYTWSVKADIREPLIYGALAVSLFVLRYKQVRQWASDFPVLKKVENFLGK